MAISRRERKRENSKIFVQRIYGALAWLFIACSLGIAYYFNILLFAILSIVVFFGILSTNCFKVRSIIPGIDSRNWMIRLAAAGLYLVAVMLLISRIGFYSNK